MHINAHIQTNQSPVLCLPPDCLQRLIHFSRQRNFCLSNKSKWRKHSLIAPMETEKSHIRIPRVNRVTIWQIASLSLFRQSVSVLSWVWCIKMILYLQYWNSLLLTYHITNHLFVNELIYIYLPSAALYLNHNSVGQ